MKIHFVVGPEVPPHLRILLAATPEVDVESGAESEVRVGTHRSRCRFLPRLSGEMMMQDVTAHLNAEEILGVVVSAALPVRERDALEAAGLSWCDGRGAVHVAMPGVLVHIDRGSQRRRVPEEKVDSSLGPASIRAVQLLLDHPLDEWTIAELAVQADVSSGQAYNVFKAMDSAALVDTIGSGPHRRRVVKDRGSVMDWLALIDRQRRRPDSVFTYVYARTDDEVLHRATMRLQAAKVPYAVTASAAAKLYGAPVLSRSVLTRIRIGGGVGLLETLDRAGLDHLDAEAAGIGSNIELISDVGGLGTFDSVEIDDVRCAPRTRVWLDLGSLESRGTDAAALFREQTLDRD